jgi:hypothetical protein
MIALMKLLSILDPPMPVENHSQANLTLIRGSIGVCPCLLDAYPPIESVSWYRNGRAIHMEGKGTRSQMNQ